MTTHAALSGLFDAWPSPSYPKRVVMPPRVEGCENVALRGKRELPGPPPESNKTTATSFRRLRADYQRGWMDARRCSS